MRPISLIVSGLLLLVLSSAFAQSPADPSGHWVGAVLVPNMEVAIEIDIAKDGAELAGTFASPDQKLRGLPLGGIAVAGREITFHVRGSAPGERQFKGTLSDDGLSLSGDYSQGGYTIPFVLNRKGDAKFEPVARSAAVGKELEGTWNGAIDAGGVLRHVSLTLANRPDGTSTGHFLSVEEGLEIPFSAISQNASELSLDVSALGGSYKGTLDPAGAELTGSWSQGPSSVPLTLKRASK